jgi:hypothetical protein
MVTCTRYSPANSWSGVDVVVHEYSSSGAAAFSSIIDHRRVIRDATVEAERAVALRDQLRGWVSVGTVQIQRGGVPGGRTTAVRARAGVPAGVTAAVAMGDELTFTTVAPTPAGSPSTRIRLFVDGDDTTIEEGLTIEYQASVGTPLQRMELDRSIGAITVEFLDRSIARWYPASEAATIQPIAVRFTLHPVEGDTLPRVLTLPFLFRMGDPTAPIAGGR